MATTDRYQLKGWVDSTLFTQATTTDMHGILKDVDCDEEFQALPLGISSSMISDLDTCFPDSREASNFEGKNIESIQGLNHWTQSFILSMCHKFPYQVHTP